MIRYKVLLLLFLSCVLINIISCAGNYDKIKQRIIVSTDIGGTDFDDYQSMVHLFLYADTFDIEGIISSPYGKGRSVNILDCIDAYEKDYPNLKNASKQYPTPYYLRAKVKQGAKNIFSQKGFAESTEGSNWIIECARRDDPRPLNILIWGGIEELAQALHDAPEILPKLRVYFIGGPNKKWSVNAYQYIVNKYPELWIIESNATYRGWFEGGKQEEEWGNASFVEANIKNCGALGQFFYAKGASMKMGDTPSLIYFLSQNPEDPTLPNWGGQYVRAWQRPHKIFNRITSLSDSIEEFGVFELQIPFTDIISEPYAVLQIENQTIDALVGNDTVKFLFSPKKASRWNYTISGNIPSINNLSGQLVSSATPASNKKNPSKDYPNWWTDDPSPEFKENGHIGIKTVNCWREEFLKDFAIRMKRCCPPVINSNNN